MQRIQWHHAIRRAFVIDIQAGWHRGARAAERRTWWGIGEEGSRKSHRLLEVDEKVVRVRRSVRGAQMADVKGDAVGVVGVWPCSESTRGRSEIENNEVNSQSGRLADASWRNLWIHPIL